MRRIIAVGGRNENLRNQDRYDIVKFGLMGKSDMKEKSFRSELRRKTGDGSAEG